VTVVGDVLGVDVVGLKVGLEVVGDDDVRHGPISSQACAHAPPYVVEKGSNSIWLHSLSRVGIAAVDLHFKICPFLDTKLPTMYAVPTTHSLGQPAVGPTATAVVVEIAVEGAMVPEHGPISSQACAHAPPYVVEKGSNPTWLHSLSRVGIAAVDLHFKICPFLDTKLPATYAVPTTHSLGQPAIGPTATDVVVEIAVEGAMVPEHGPIS